MKTKQPYGELMFPSRRPTKPRTLVMPKQGKTKARVCPYDKRQRCGVTWHGQMCLAFLWPRCLISWICCCLVTLQVAGYLCPSVGGGARLRGDPRTSAGICSCPQVDSDKRVFQGWE